MGQPHIIVTHVQFQLTLVSGGQVDFMTYALLGCQLILATVLLLAATGKVLNLDQFESTLRLSHLPDRLVLPTTVATPSIEVCLAAALVLSPPRLLWVAMSAVSVLLAMFTIWMVSVYIRGLRLACGCFGAGSSEVGRGTIERNGLLILLSLFGLILAPNVQSPLPSSPLWMTIIALSIGLSVMLARALLSARKGLVLSLRQLLQDHDAPGSPKVPGP